MRHRILDTCTGPFVIILYEDGRLVTTWMNDNVRAMLAGSREDAKLLADLSDRLVRYFAGEAVDFSDVPTPWGSDFYRRCWDACRRIPRGQTISYGELAIRAGSTSGAARAAGQAMRNNPLPVIIPCHRVVGSDRQLHGFGGSCDQNGSELGTKRILLELEGALDALAVA